MTLADIAAELGVAKSSVSTWVADVAFEPTPRRSGLRRPSRLHLDRLADVQAAHAWAAEVIGTTTDRDLLIAGIALYAGEGGKTGNEVLFVNSDHRLVVLFLRWLRTGFDLDERRLRCRLYLHDDLSIAEATQFWVGVTGIPPTQFMVPHRPARRPGQATKYPMGCLTVRYNDAAIKRRITALMDALLQSESSFRGSSAGRAVDC